MLHLYQRRMANMILMGGSCALWAEMGLGKTLATLTAIEEMIYDHLEPIKALVLAPKFVAENTWPEEVKKWYPHMRVSLVAGDVKSRRKALEVDADIYVLCRNNIPWLFGEYTIQNTKGWKWSKPWPFNLIVIDEASSFKSPSGTWFKTLARIRRANPQIIELTGTPKPNEIEDLWAQMYLLDGGERLYDGVGKFRQRWMEPHGFISKHIPILKGKKGAYEEIMERCSDICISLMAEDWLKMPERIDNVIRVKIPMAVYHQVQEEAVYVDGDSVVTGGSAAVVLGKLLQIANGRVYDEDKHVVKVHTAKQDALKDIIEDNTLIFYSYKHDVDAIREAIPDAVELNSQTMQKWNRGEIRVLYAHPASAGHGLNLQHGGSHILWYGLPFNLEWYLQANARLHRQGQKHTVIIHHLIAEGTAEEQVLRALQRKQLGQQEVLDAVRYRPDAVEV